MDMNMDIIEGEEHDYEQKELRLVTVRAFFVAVAMLVVSGTVTGNLAMFVGLVPIAMSAGLGQILVSSFECCPRHSFRRIHPGFLLAADLFLAMSMLMCIVMVWLLPWPMKLDLTSAMCKTFASIALAVNMLTHGSLVCEISWQLCTGLARARHQRRCTCVEDFAACEDNVQIVTIETAQYGAPPPYEDAPQYEDVATNSAPPYAISNAAGS